MKELNKGKKISKGEELSLHNPMVIVIAEEQQKNYLKWQRKKRKDNITFSSLLLF